MSVIKTLNVFGIKVIAEILENVMIIVVLVIQIVKSLMSNVQ